MKTPVFVGLVMVLAALVTGLIGCNSSLPSMDSWRTPMATGTLSAADLTKTAQSIRGTDNALAQAAADAEMMALAARQTGEAASAAQTQRVLDAEATAVALTQAAESRSLTATAAIEAPTLTHVAINSMLTLTAYPLTATAEATAAYVSGRVTSSALQILDATTKSEVDRITNQGTVKRTTDAAVIWVDAMLPRLAIALAAGLLIWGAWLTLRRLVPALAAVAGIVRHGKDGKPTLVVPLPNGGVAFADLSRNDGPVIAVTGKGEVSSPVQASEQTLARAGLENLALAVQEGNNPAAGREVLRQATKEAAGAQPSQQRWEVFPGGSRPSLPPQDSEIVEAAWREAQATTEGL